MEITRVGAYRLEDRLGAGGMGIVYRAYDERLDRRVAVKFLPPEAAGDPDRRERLRREARANARLSHPVIVQIFDFVEADDFDAIVMELVEGTRLSRLLREGALEVERALAVAGEIADGLAEAHSHGIVHRDLKAENVLITPSGHPKVFDFGIAKRLDGSDVSLTIDGNILGTFRCMAPEQAEDRAVDHRADLFAFGVLLYEMLTARSPFRGRSVNETLDRICFHRQPPVAQRRPGVPEALSELVDQLLEKEPERRPQSAREVAARLARIAAGFGSPAPAPFEEEEEAPTAVEIRMPAAADPDARPSPFSGPPFSYGSAERRQVTVLRCGLANPGGEPLDPEEMIDEMPALHARAAEVVRRFDGHLSPLRESAVVAYFGYPRAHEDDARRATRAALEIAGQIRRLGERSGRPKLTRIGLHTGSAVVVRSGEGELALGDVPAVATHLMEAAAPGEILAGVTTWRLLKGAFECRELDPLVLPGSPLPARAFQVTGRAEVPGGARFAGILAPLVGREQELGLLLSRWELAREGRGQAVLLRGDPGLGKSRLVWELKQRIATEAPDWLEGFSSPDHQDSAFYPILQILQQAVGGGAVGEDLAHRLEETLARHDLPPEAASPLSALIAQRAGGAATDLSEAPDTRQRRKLLHTLLSLLLRAAELRPLLVIVEDLQWADPSSLELLERLLAQLSATPMLLLMTARSEFDPPWGRSPPTILTLGALTRSQVGTLIERLTPAGCAEESVVEAIATRADGVPLFVEELTKMALEEGGREPGEETTPGGRSPGDVPESLDGWLRARLDRLGTARGLAQIASACGREFSYELLSAVFPWPNEVLDRDLAMLVDADLLYRRGVPPNSRYVFKHSLLQEAAYGSLLRSDRARLHGRIAEALEERFPAISERHPELLAHHFTEAGLTDRAVELWQRAGEAALRASAFREAVGHCERALLLLEGLPESAERDRREIALQMALGTARASSRSDGVPDVHRAYSRALELYHRHSADFPPGLLHVALRGLFVHHLIAGRPQAAFEAARQLFERAQDAGDSDLRTVALQCLGYARLFLGDPAGARRDLEEALATPVAPVVADFGLLGVGALRLTALGNLAWALWLLGLPEQAAERARQTTELAHATTDSPAGLCLAEYLAAEYHALARDPETATPLADSVFQRANEQGLPFFSALGTVLLGWVHEERARGEGIALMCAGVAEQLSLQAGIVVLNHLALLAGSYLRAGWAEETQAALEQAFEVQGEQRIMEPELLRIEAELLALRGGKPEEVEARLRHALETARAQGARAFELRTATRLARLLQQQGRGAKAREILAPVYEAFTEGFDTPDLREARAVLEG